MLSLQSAECWASGAASSRSEARAAATRRRLQAVVRLGVSREPRMGDAQHWPVCMPLAPPRYSRSGWVSPLPQRGTAGWAACRTLSPPRRTPARPYLITASAWKRRLGGMVRPSASAVFRLMISSNFVGCSTGKSAGLAPLRILST
jgi:hypothetical protein